MPTAPVDSNIYIYDATTLNFLGTINDRLRARPGVGLAGDPDRGVLWGVARHGSPGTLYEIDPSTGAIINDGPDNNQGLYEQDLAYANGQLIVSDTNGYAAPAINFLDEYDPDTLGFVQRVPVAVHGLRLRPGRRRPGRRQQRLVPVQRQRRRQPGPHDDHARRHQRQRPAVHQRSRPDDQPLRRQRQPGRHRDRQCGRRPQRRHRLDGAHLGQLPRADPGRQQDQPGRVHDQHPGRHGRPRPVHGDLDQPGRRIGSRLPGLDA